jgi:hypothetical protein
VVNILTASVMISPIVTLLVSCMGPIGVTFAQTRKTPARARPHELHSDAVTESPASKESKGVITTSISTRKDDRAAEMKSKPAYQRLCTGGGGITKQ